MPVDPQFVGLLQILLGVVSLFFLKPVSGNRDRAGSWSFAVLCVGIGVYGLSAGLDWFVSGYALSHFVFTFWSLGGVLITTAWLVLALSVTDRVPVGRRLWAAFAGYVVATQLFFWTDPLHHLVVAPGSTMNGANFDPTIGVGLWAILGVGYRPGAGSAVASSSCVTSPTGSAASRSSNGKTSGWTALPAWSATTCGTR